jgi:hypothetical protein
MFARPPFEGGHTGVIRRARCRDATPSSASLKSVITQRHSTKEGVGTNMRTASTNMYATPRCPLAKQHTEHGQRWPMPSSAQAVADIS